MVSNGYLYSFVICIRTRDLYSSTRIILALIILLFATYIDIRHANFVHKFSIIVLETNLLLLRDRNCIYLSHISIVADLMAHPNQCRVPTLVL